MKKVFTYLLDYGKYILRRNNLMRTVKQKIKHLKSSNSFERFPLDAVTPVVSEYSYFRKGDRPWLDFFYSVYGQPLPDFIPLTIYYQTIEPKLNNYVLLQAIKEKNFYNKFFTNIKTPRTILRRINGSFYDAEFKNVILSDAWIENNIMAENELIVKPSVQSGAGKSIMKFIKNGHSVESNINVLNVNYLLNYHKDFIIQEVVKQHQFFRQFNPGANNTLRIFTYRSVVTNQVHILHTLVRIGKDGEFMDHDNLGGIAIAIDHSGKLKSHAFDVNGNKYSAFNGVKFDELEKVPLLDKFQKVAEELAYDIYYGRLLAFDFTVNEHGDPLLIEINCQHNGVSQYQMNNGSLFGEFTQEILEYCENTKPRYVFTY